jgi:flagellar biogenesis protein FliO
VPQLPPTLALAAHHAATTPGSTGAQSVSASSLLIQMVVGLIVIVFLIKMASKFVQGRGGRAGRVLGHGPRAQGVSVIGRQSLGKGVQVAMVAAGKQTYLLGVTQRQVTLLGEVDTDAAAADEQEAAVGGLQLLRGGNRPALAAGGSRPTLKSTLEQMRDRTARRA